MRALLSSPTYGPIDPRCASSLRYAVMVAARNHTTWSADLSPDRMTYSSARNMVAKWVNEHPLEQDGIVWVDSDIVLSHDSLWKLLASAERTGADLYSGVYHARREPFEPVFYTFNITTMKFKQACIYEPDTVYEVDGCGFGIVYTSTRLIQAIAKSQLFSEDGKWFPDLREGNGPYGEDLGFCFQAMKLGFRCHVDTGIQVGHMGDFEPITRATYLQALSGLGKTVEVSGKT